MLRNWLTIGIGLAALFAVLMFVTKGSISIGKDKSKVLKMGGETLFIVAVAIIGVSGIGAFVLGVTNTDLHFHF